MEKIVTSVKLGLTEEELATLKKAANILADMADLCMGSNPKVTVDELLIQILDANAENIKFVKENIVKE